MSDRFTVVEAGGVGTAVRGSVFSVGLCFSDARRHDEGMVWLLATDGSLVGFDTSVGWEVAEVDRAEG